MIRAAIYTRVSTEQQAEDGYSLGEQRTRLEAFCIANNYEIFDFYEDAGFSGKDLHRPAMERLIHDAEHKSFNMVIVLKLDRLSRNQRDILYLLEDVFEPNGVEFKSATEPFQTDNLMGKFAISMLAIFAQIERQTIRDRLVLGRAAAVKDGHWGGSGIVPLGYTRKDDNTLEIDEAGACIYFKIVELVESGYNFRQIENYLAKEGIKGVNGGRIEGTGIRRMLRSKTYLGMVSYAGEWSKGLHEPLISQERFDKLQARLDILCNPDIVNKANNLLSGLTWCPYCGARIGHCKTGRDKNGVAYEYYFCYSHSGNKKMVKSNNCPNKAVRCDWLDKYVTDKILSLKFEDIKSQAEDKIDYAKKIKQLRDKYKRLTDLYISGSIPLDVLDAKSAALQKSIQALEEEATLQGDNLTNKALVRNSLTIARDVFENGSMDEKRALVQSLITRIEYYSKDHIDIWWNL